MCPLNINGNYARTWLITSSAKFATTFSRESESLTGKQITDLAAERTTRTHYSDRYACAYLVQEEGPDVWYLNGQAIRERIQLARLFGGGRLCLSDLNNALPETLEAMP